MKKVFITSFVFVFTLCGFANTFAQETKNQAAFQAQKVTYKKVEIMLDNQADLDRIASLGIDLRCGANVSHKDDKHVVTLEISSNEIAQLQNANLQPRILIEDMADFYAKRAIRELPKARENLQRAKLGGLYKNAEAGQDLGCTEDGFPVPANFNLGSMGGMYTYQEMLDELDRMRTLYPNLITVRTPLSTTLSTIEGRDVFYVKVSDNADVDENEAEVLYTGVHHAREPMSMMNLMYYMWYLMENYATDPKVKNIVDNTELYFIPIVNPDGYLYNESTNPNGGGFWRKNRRNNGGSFGVDLNRNYGYQWGLNDIGSSPSPSSDVYRGPSAFSEPETQMVRDFVQSHNFVNAFNNHAYSNLMIHPWGFTATPAPNAELYGEISEHMCWHNRYHYGNGDEVIYSVNGEADDWFYGVEGVLAWTPEIGSGAEGGFWPSPTNIVPQCERQMKMSLIAASSAANYGVLNDLTPYDLDPANPTLTFSVEHMSNVDGGFTINVSSSSPNVTAIANPTLSTGSLTQANFATISTGVTIAPGTPQGTAITFDVVLNNGTYDIHTTTITKSYDAPTLIEDDATNLNNWTSSAGWNITNSTGYNDSSSITDSPTGNMTTAERTLTLNAPLDLSNTQFPVLEYYTKWDIARLFDYVQIEVSVDGTSWAELCGTYTKPGTSSANVYNGNPDQPTGEGLYDGFQKEWVREEIDLSAYSGINALYLRFKADGDTEATQLDGFYFDNFTVYSEPLGHCGNDTQDADEVGIDCGGVDCIPCPSCSDGVQNGDETAVDCGGTNCAACPPCSGVTLTLTLDDYPAETSWSIVDAAGGIVTSGSGYSNSNTTVSGDACLFVGCYDFIINDTYGDGICCVSGNGSYTLTDDATGNALASGGDFGASESTNFCFNAPTCAGVDLDINFDGEPTQTSWEITDASGSVVASSGGNVYGAGLANSNLALPDISCLPDGCYDLTFMDSGNDGMCPRRTSTVLTGINIATLGLGGVFNGIPRVAQVCGDYTLTDANGTLLASGGGRFGTSETNNFCISGGVAELVQPNNDWNLAQNNNRADLQILPNLVQDEMTVIYSLKEMTNAELQIIDINGKVLQQHNQNGTGTQQVRLNVGELASGFYFMRLMSGDIVMTKKFVKQ